METFRKIANQLITQYAVKINKPYANSNELQLLVFTSYSSELKEIEKKYNLKLEHTYVISNLVQGVFIIE